MKDLICEIEGCNIQLLFGDCLERMEEIPTGSVDLVATDLPYGISQNKWDTIIPFVPLWIQLKRVLKAKGAAVFTATQPFASQLVMSNTKWYKYDTIWEKTVGSGQLNIGNRPLRVHENILVFYDKLGTYNEQKMEGEPYRMLRKTDKFEGGYGKQRDHEKINEGFRHARSIIEIPNPRVKGGHKTQKPVGLMEYIAKVYSNEYETVLDCCMGAGTTGEACINLKRHFIGIELEKEWFEKSVKRLEKRLYGQVQIF